MSKSVGDYYKQYNDGSPFSDEELKDALDKMGKLTDDLNSLGFAFVLPYREIRRVYGGLEDYYYARFKVLWRPK